MERERTQTCAQRTLTHSLRGFLLIRVRTHNILRIQVMNICSIHCAHNIERSLGLSFSPAKQFSLLLQHCRVIYFSVRFGIQLQILF